MNKVVSKKKRVKRNVPTGIATISASFNNTIVTFADANGDVITWSSAGSKGFKGSRRSTPFAAQVAAEDAARKAIDCGMKSCSVIVTGPGSGRESAVRAISATGIKVTLIKDATPVPHNGCRPPKRRRV
ncbi:30S ribosomal protein S11 [Pigmentibacter sp. JX0631]|jgi:small subunit ribosomal protein S11|uniref:Small ribosomal subunit protein uS11 n=2 Tax=Silvanigrella TaxID=2024975 RepID=A0A1L4D2V1_9BACT|nr:MULTISPECIES: 30S ribosomal protein S11 [Silvanigrellaceae]APJ04517.1 30S ribosomal protein S11 [Silvanigrella aquatica]KAB8037587.1 30S ribosomal protein S11 [Silvanigrella paludirubra]WGL60756.1 30S ribosomal protein S11 [Pigmentibacter sp. JX0631]